MFVWKSNCHLYMLLQTWLYPDLAMVHKQTTKLETYPTVFWLVNRSSQEEVCGGGIKTNFKEQLLTSKSCSMLSPFLFTLTSIPSLFSSSPPCQLATVGENLSISATNKGHWTLETRLSWLLCRGSPSKNRSLNVQVKTRPCARHETPPLHCWLIPGRWDGLESRYGNTTTRHHQNTKTVPICSNKWQTDNKQTDKLTDNVRSDHGWHVTMTSHMITSDHMPAEKSHAGWEKSHDLVFV